MPQLLIRGLTQEVVDKLKARAQKNGRSLEAELRLVLEQAAKDGT
jgi:plasmid stability protein